MQGKSVMSLATYNAESWGDGMTCFATETRRPPYVILVMKRLQKQWEVDANCGEWGKGTEYGVEFNRISAKIDADLSLTTE